MTSLKSFLALLLCSVLIAGCASLPVVDMTDISSSPGDEYAMEFDLEPEGVYHKVQAGETIWRIAKAYNVPMQEIIDSNNIPDVAQVEVNQLLMIPTALSVREVFIVSDNDPEEFVWPVEGKIINYFNQRKGFSVYKGIDIKTRPGESIKASRAGRVVFSDFLTGYGKMVILDHEDGFYSVYANNEENLVKLNDKVQKNMRISKVSQVDKKSYLHFEIRRHSKEQNPLFYLP